MTELREDFILLIRYSCQVAFPRCEALLSLHPVKSVLGHESSSDRKTRVLRMFLEAAVAYGVGHASSAKPAKPRKGPSEQEVVRGAAANIGLKPWLGKRKDIRDDAAGAEVGRLGSAVRHPYWRDQFAGTLVQVVADFVEDQDAAQAWVRNTESLLRSSTGVHTDQSATPSAYDDQRPPLLSSYVHRPEMEAKFRSLVDAGAKLIVLAGQPGMGKTTLAVELAKDTTTELPAPLIQVTQGEIAAKDIAAMLALYEFQSPTNPDPLVQLSTFLCAPLAPTFFVLDNLDSSDELSKLLPRTTKSTIIATCRRKGDAPLRHASYINVGNMTRVEASQLIKIYLSDLPADDVRHVAEMFGNYPLVLSYVAATCRNLRMGIKDFCIEPATDIITLAEGVRTEEGKTLLAVLRFMVSAIAQRDPLALDVLIYSSFNFNYRSPAWYMPFFIRYLSGSSAGSVTRLRVIQAFQVLQNFALLTPSGSSGLGSSRLHPFTAAILSAEFSSKLPEIEERIRALDVASHDDTAQFLTAIRSGCPGSTVLESEPEGEPLVMRYFIADELHTVEYVPILFHIGLIGLRITPDMYSKSTAGSDGISASSTIDHDAVEREIEQTLSHLSYAKLTQRSEQIIRNVYYEIVRTMLR